MKPRHLFEIAALLSLGSLQGAHASGMTCSFSSQQLTAVTGQSIEVGSFSIRPSASSDAVAGSGSKAASVLEIKALRSESSDQLIAMGVTGTVFDTVTCRIARSQFVGVANASYLTAVLSNVELGGFSVDATAEDKDAAPHETLSLNYSKIEWTYTQQK